jgi:hypothetical protein
LSQEPGQHASRPTAGEPVSIEAVEELGGDPGEIRRAARAVGRRLGWKTVTREIDGRIFVLDDREPPRAVRDLMQRRATDALDAFLSRGD